MSSVRNFDIISHDTERKDSQFVEWVRVKCRRPEGRLATAAATLTDADKVFPPHLLCVVRKLKCIYFCSMEMHSCVFLPCFPQAVWWELTAVHNTWELHYGERLQASVEFGASRRELPARRFHWFPGHQAEKVEPTDGTFWLLLPSHFQLNLDLKRQRFGNVDAATVHVIFMLSGCRPTANK